MFSRILCAAVAGLFAIPLVATAQLRDQRTYFTFSQPVELPGTTLPAGTYLFRLVDSESNRHVVRIMSEDGTEVETTLMAIPARRMTPSDEPEVRFMETPASEPSAISTWWYPGNTTGHEFIWPRERAMQLASASEGRVLSVPEGTEWDGGSPTEDPDLTRVGPDGSETTVSENAAAAEVTGRAQEGRTDTTERTASAPAATERTDTAERAANERRAPQPAPDPQETDTAEPRRTSLPATAGVMPLIALIGFGSLSAGLIMRRRCNR